MNQERRDQIRQKTDEMVEAARRIAQGFNSGRIQGSAEDKRDVEGLHRRLAIVRALLNDKSSEVLGDG